MTRTIRMKDIAGLKANTTTAPYATTEPTKIGGVRGTQNSTSDGSWQAKLDQNFDIAETFDLIEDWNPLLPGGSYHSGTGMPVMIDGSPSKFEHFSNDFTSVAITNKVGDFTVDETVTFGNGATFLFQRYHTENGYTFIQGRQAVGNTAGIVIGMSLTGSSSGATGEVAFIPPWIGSYGPTHRNRGKSLTVNYNNFSGGIDGFGPSRLSMFFGNGLSGNSGYKKIHIFMMLKFDPAFFDRNPDGTFSSPGVHKFAHLGSGFTGIWHWGNDSEHLRASNTEQNRGEYGLQPNIFTTSGGGLSTPNSLFFKENPAVASDVDADGLWTPNYYIDSGGRALYDFGTTDGSFANKVLADEWFGLELVADIGTLNGGNGSQEIYMYDQQGNLFGSYVSPQETRKIEFDHLYNKFTLGGNRLCSGYGLCPVDAHSRMYIDDLIIHGSPIAANYFNLLSLEAV